MLSFEPTLAPRRNAAMPRRRDAACEGEQPIRAGCEQFAKQGALRGVGRSVCLHTGQMTLSGTVVHPQTSAPRRRVRYIGVDLARFIAIAGMMASHLVAIRAFLPDVVDPELAIVKSVNLVTSGGPAALFAVLGGVSIVFATRSQLRDGSTGRAIASVAVRGVVLVVLGVLLGFVGNSIIVILAYYGVAMLLVAPLVAARSWVIATIAGVLGLLSGWVNINVRYSLGVPVEGPHFSAEFFAADPMMGLRALLLTGEYPAVTWVTYLLVGMLLGRALTSATSRGSLGRTAMWIASIGAMVFVVAQLISTWALANLDKFGVIESGNLEEVQDYLMQYGGGGAPPSRNLFVHLIAVPHSGSVMDLLRTIALALMLIGLLVYLCDRERPQRTSEAAPGGVGARLIDVVRATGAAPLTIYTLHIVVSGLLQGAYFSQTEAWATADQIPWWAAGAGAFALQIAGALAIGAVLSATKKRGPLEALLSNIVRIVVPPKR